MKAGLPCGSVVRAAQVGPLDPCRLAVLGLALAQRGLLLYRTGTFREARSLLAESLATLRPLDEAALLAPALIYSGIVSLLHRCLDQGCVLALPRRGPPGHPAPLRARLVEPGREGRGPLLLPRRQGPLQPRALHPARRGPRRAVPALPHHRPRRQPVPQRTQTRRIGPLVDQYPEPRLELHPALAERLGIADGDWASVKSRRGGMTIQASVVGTIRPDTIFIPYHMCYDRTSTGLKPILTC